MSDIHEELEEQQGQIYSLSNSIEQVATYLQHSQKNSDATISELSISIQELSKYVLAVASNMDILKQDIEELKQDIHIVKKQNLVNDQAKALKSIQENQNQLSEPFMQVLRSLRSQQQQLNELSGWKYLAIIVGSISLTAACSSFVGAKIVVSNLEQEMQGNDAALAVGVQRIKEHLGIK